VLDAQHEEDESEGDSFDSLDDFIVSDDNELSYHEVTENESSETEAETRPSLSPEPSPRKRLMRGRRPMPQAETKMEEGAIEKAPLSPNHKVPSPVKKESRRARATKTPSPGRESPILRAVAPESRTESTSSSQFGLDSPTDIINSLRELELDSENESPLPTARIESRYDL
jgi:hypothetical protein